MIHYVMSVYDKQAQAFMQPFFTVNIDTGTRAVRQVMTDPSHPFSCFPTDYSLMVLGQFDDSDGKFTQQPGGFTTVAQLIQLVPQKPAQGDLLQTLINTKEG